MVTWQFFFYFRASIFKNTFFFQGTSSECFWELLESFVFAENFKNVFIGKMLTPQHRGGLAPSAPSPPFHYVHEDI